jgi:16S rRNA (guanine527-N7)-methyltransferase
LRQVVIELDIKNVTIITTRLEHYQPLNQFDVIVTRAFSELELFVKNASRLCKPHGRLLAMKGQYPAAELDSLPRSLVMKVTKLKVPSLKAERHAVELLPNF